MLPTPNKCMHVRTFVYSCTHARTHARTHLDAGSVAMLEVGRLLLCVVVHGLSRDSASVIMMVMIDLC